MAVVLVEVEGVLALIQAVHKEGVQHLALSLRLAEDLAAREIQLERLQMEALEALEAVGVVAVAQVLQGVLGTHLQHLPLKVVTAAIVLHLLELEPQVVAVALQLLVELRQAVWLVVAAQEHPPQYLEHQ